MQLGDRVAQGVIRDELAVRERRAFCVGRALR